MLHLIVHKLLSRTNFKHAINLPKSVGVIIHSVDNHLDLLNVDNFRVEITSLQCKYIKWLD